MVTLRALLRQQTTSLSKALPSRCSSSHEAFEPGLHINMPKFLAVSSDLSIEAHHKAERQKRLSNQTK